jgi:tetratricopeptide (TPR) repeat protein
MAKRPPRPSPASPAVAAPSPPVAAGGWRTVWLAGLVFGATLLAYFPAINAGFVWNDRDYVTKPALRSVAGLARIWTEVGATEQYYPLLHSAFWLEHRLWGDAAAGYHLVNILLHATAACLLALILRRLAVPGAWLAALLFALHPVCVESVAWIAEQKNTLSTVLYLAAALAYLRFDEQRSVRRYALATGWFALALLTKSVTATLTGALLVVAWWRHGRLEWKRDVVQLIPWIVAGAAVGLFTGWVEREIGGAKGLDYQLTLVERCLVAGRAFWFYLGQLAWPADLVFIYPRWSVSGAVAWQYLYPLTAVALMAGLWLLRRRSRAPLAAALFFAGSLFPVLGFFNVYAFVFSYVADHWQYLPSLGMITLAAAGTATGLARLPRPLLWPGRAVVAGVVVLLGGLTWRETRQYRDIETFYQTIIDRNPGAWMAHYNLGNVLRNTGRAAEAVARYEAALQARPDMADARTALGLALLETGRGGEAIAHLEEALRLDPGYIAAHNALGGALAEAGRLPEAIAHYEAALGSGATLPDVHNNLGIALLMADRAAEAVTHFEAVLRVDPNLPEVRMNLATALEIAGRPAEAAAQVEAARRLGFPVPPRQP